MSSYHFPIFLGQNKSERVVIIHLVDDQVEFTENRVVITPPGSPTTPLFKIPKEVKIVDENGVEERDKILSIDNGQEKRGLLNKNKNNRLLKVSIDGHTLKPNVKLGFYEFYVNTDKFDGTVEFSLSSYDKDGKATDTKGSLHIVRRVRNDTMLWLTADLGSDATQVSYLFHKLRQNDESVSKIFLLDALRRDYNDKDKGRNYPDRPTDIDEPVFIQEERDSPYYYKTGNITFKEKGNVDNGIDDDDCFINYLTVSAVGKNKGYASSSVWDKENTFKRKLINIKMLYSEIDEGDSPAVQAVDFSFTDGDGYGDPKPIADRNNLIKVLRSIYKQIIEVSTKQFVNECEYYSVLLLVPNIYSQKNIDILLYDLNTSMNPKYDDKPEEGKKRKLFDFRIISESDSAFIGLNEVGRGNAADSLIEHYLKKQKITEDEKKDTFLVVDAGKGTTDYSIIRYTRGRGDANNQVTSLDRNGIVGAGGAIDYVFARILARQIYRHRSDFGSIEEEKLVTESDFVNDFMKMIQYLYPVDQDKFMLIVEKLKIGYQRDYYNKKCTMAKMYECFSIDDESKKIISLLLKKDPDKEEKLKTVSKEYTDGLNAIAKLNLDDLSRNREDGVENDWKEVETICEIIANAIINNQVFENGDTPLTNSIDYVIFTGRSFLFQPLKDAFERTIKPRRNVFRENYKGWFAYKKDVKAVKDAPDRKEDLGNLKIAKDIVETKDMKPISVRYRYHDLGVNCNSNLCCVKGLSSSGEGKGIISKEKFWTGFKGVGQAQNSTYYYIGYNESFACDNEALQELQRENNSVPYDYKDELIRMTLFPVKYVPVPVEVLSVKAKKHDLPKAASPATQPTDDDVEGCTQQKINK